MPVHVTNGLNDETLNVISSGTGIELIAGDPDYTNAVVAIRADSGSGGATIYAQDDGDTHDITLRITATAATLRKDGVTRTLSSLRPEDNFADDAAAIAGGIGLGELYHTSGTVKVRIS